MKVNVCDCLGVALDSKSKRVGSNPTAYADFYSPVAQR